jgi:hypothetical protein
MTFFAAGSTFRDRAPRDRRGLSRPSIQVQERVVERRRGRDPMMLGRACAPHASHDQRPSSRPVVRAGAGVKSCRGRCGRRPSTSGDRSPPGRDRTAIGDASVVAASARIPPRSKRRKCLRRAHSESPSGGPTTARGVPDSLSRVTLPVPRERSRYPTAERVVKNAIGSR